MLEALEAHVIMPLENAEVSQELGLKPKRGVLLAGPPGTGKTTIGRALARRLKSKFFLLDGTVISGTPDFFPRVQRIFEAAKQNAPCIIFIDDSDVIFESGNDTGLYRYLLTMLDGLESASAGRICLMMTAMDVGNLPPASSAQAASSCGWKHGCPASRRARTSFATSAPGCLRRSAMSTSMRLPRRAKASPAPTSSASSTTEAPVRLRAGEEREDTAGRRVLPDGGGDGTAKQAAVRRGRGSCPSAPPPAPGLFRSDERARGHDR